MSAAPAASSRSAPRSTLAALQLVPPAAPAATVPRQQAPRQAVTRPHPRPRAAQASPLPPLPRAPAPRRRLATHPPLPLPRAVRPHRRRPRPAPHRPAATTPALGRPRQATTPLQHIPTANQGTARTAHSVRKLRAIPLSLIIRIRWTLLAC